MEIVSLTLNRPQKRNAISASYLKTLQKQLQNLLKYDGVKVLVIRGAGEDFCSGLDLDELKQMKPKEMKKFFQTGKEFVKALMKVGKKVFTIAALDGHVHGPALDFMLACRHRLATKNATFGIPKDQSAFLLSKILGPRRTQRLFPIGKMWSAKAVHKAGLIHAISEGNLWKSALNAGRAWIKNATSRSAMSKRKAKRK